MDKRTPLEKLLTPLEPKFREALAKYLADCKQANERQDFEIIVGKMLKVTHCLLPDRDDFGVFCFIDMTNGDLYKAETWHRPAKGVRGNIYQEKRPVTSKQFYKR